MVPIQIHQMETFLTSQNPKTGKRSRSLLSGPFLVNNFELARCYMEVEYESFENNFGDNLCRSDVLRMSKDSG